MKKIKIELNKHIYIVDGLLSSDPNDIPQTLEVQPNCQS